MIPRLPLGKYGQLPDVPNAASIEKDGQSLGEMNKILLKKLEELTLYLLEKYKEISEIKKELKNIKRQK